MPCIVHSYNSGSEFLIERAAILRACAPTYRPRLKAEIEIELYATGRTRRHWQPEKRRDLIANIAQVIDSIQDVEGADADFDRRSFISLLPVLRRLEKEFLRPAQIERRGARPLQTVAAHAEWPVVGDRVAIVVAPGAQAVGTSGSNRNRYPKIEPVSGLERAQQVESM